jgi:hypothetical protein
VTFAFRDFTVTTWGQCDGKQVWRARGGEKVVDFFAERDTDAAVLARLARLALGLPPL